MFEPRKTYSTTAHEHLGGAVTLLVITEKLIRTSATLRKERKARTHHAILYTIELPTASDRLAAGSSAS